MARIRKQETIAADKKSDGNIIWRIAVYIRLSKEDGNDESESVVNQKKILIEYLEKYFEGEYAIADFYVDDGLTGTDDTRKDFMRMIQDIEDSRVNCVVCKTLARAFRNYSDQGYYLEYYFQQKNIRFISTGDPKIDTFTNPEAITGLEVPITGLMNDRFAGRTSSDVRRTFATKRRNGEFIGAFPPYGYLKHPEDKNRLILDEEIVPIKRDMLRWIIQDGMSLNGVAKKLNEWGVPSPTMYKRSKGWNYRNPQDKNCDGLWSGTMVKPILMDKVNLGHMVQGKQRVVSYKVHDRVSVPKSEWFVKENTHEPTFSQEEYDTLERLLKRDTRTPNGERKVYLFSGFLRCYGCKKALQRRTSSNYTYYACRTYTEKSKDKCTKHSIRVDTLESAVLASIQAQIALIESLREIVDEINESKVVDTQSQRLEKIRRDKYREQKTVSALSDELYVDYKTKGLITEVDFRRLKSKFEEQLAQIETAIVNLEEEQRLIGQGVGGEDEIFAEVLKHKNVRQLDRSLLIELVDTIYVHEDKQITIQFRFADELERVLAFVDINT